MCDFIRKASDFGELQILPRTSPDGAFQFTWLTKDFSKCYGNTGIGEYYQSPVFCLGLNNKCEWTLDMFAAGHDYYHADYVGIRMFYLGISKPNKKFTIEISLLTKNGEKAITRKATLNHVLRNGHFRDFVLRRDLWNDSDLLYNDEMNFICKIWIGEPKNSDGVGQLQRIRDDSRRILQNLWDHRQFTDFKIIVGEREFRVHRSILAAASPVFRAMFSSEMRETTEGTVNIEGVIPEVMEKTLHFIYTGQLDKKGGHLDKILTAAERYQLDLLKQVCETALLETINANNIYEILSLADQNNSDTMKKNAIEFFLKSGRKLIIKATNFKDSIRNLPVSLQTEIIHTFMTKR